jgi:hypothetical protein
LRYVLDILIKLLVSEVHINPMFTTLKV